MSGLTILNTIYHSNDSHTTTLRSNKCSSSNLDLAKKTENHNTSYKIP